MSLIESVKARLSGKKSFDKVSLDDLRREKIRLDREEARFIGRSEQIEKQKEQLFQQLVNEPSQIRQTILARKIKERDEEGKGHLRLSRYLGHQLRIVNGLIAIKEEARMMSKEAVGLLSKIPFDELVSYVEDVTTDSEFERGRIKDLLKTLEEGQSLVSTPLAEEDEDVQKIVAIAQEVRSHAEAGEVSAEKVQDGLRQVNSLLRDETEATTTV
ncbi:MAG: hypothetical protein DRI01_06750 [Chloroflexi bacterium]|nr:MAG: hypothetical protein DRI01_06750 [Chloroflexota bacterium]